MMTMRKLAMIKTGDCDEINLFVVDGFIEPIDLGRRVQVHGVRG